MREGRLAAAHILAFIEQNNVKPVLTPSFTSDLEKVRRGMSPQSANFRSDLEKFIVDQKYFRSEIEKMRIPIWPNGTQIKYPDLFHGERSVNNSRLALRAFRGGAGETLALAAYTLYKAFAPSGDGKIPEEKGVPGKTSKGQR